MRKKIGIILLVFLTICFAAYFYLNAVFLPVHLKKFINAKAEEYLGRKLIFTEIGFTPLKGLSVKDLTIYRKDDPFLPFVHIDEIDILVPLFAVLKDRQFIVSSVTIRNPSLYISRIGPEEWNFSDLLNKQNASGKANPLPQIYLSHLSVEQGKVELIDKTSDPAYKETLENIQILAGLSLRKGIQFSFSGHLKNQDALIRSQGNFQLLDKSLDLQLDVTNLILSEILNRFYQPSDITLTQSRVNQAALHLTFKGQELSLQGSLKAFSDLTLRDQTRVTGTVQLDQLALTKTGDDLKISGLLSTDPETRITTNKNQQLQGNLTLNNFQFARTAQQGIQLSTQVQANALDVKVSDECRIRGDINSPLLNVKYTDGNLQINGDLQMQNLDAQFKDQVFQGEILSSQLSLTQNATETQIKSPDVQFNIVKLTASPENTLSGKLTANAVDVHIENDNTIKLTGNFVSDSLQMLLAQNITYAGRPKGELALEYDPRKPTPLTYSGQLNLDSSQITNLPQISDIKDIIGEFTFDENKIKTSSASFTVLNNKIGLAGKLSDYQDPSADIVLTSYKIDLNKLYPLFAPYLEKLQIIPSGFTDLTLSYQGKINDYKNAKINIFANLDQVAVKSAKFPYQMTDVKGLLEYSTDLISWKNLTGALNGENMTFNGSLTDFSRPIVETQFESKNISFNTRFKILNNAFSITQLVGQVYNSDFDLTGDVHLQEKNDPELDFKGKLNVDLQDLAKLPIPDREKIRSNLPEAKLNMNVLFQGRALDYKNAVIDIKGHSEQMTIKGLKLQNLNFDFTQGDKAATSLKLDATFYDGLFTLNLTPDLKSESFAFKMSADLKKADFGLLSKDLPIKDHDLSGDLYFTTHLSGSLLNTKTILGGGSLRIENGRIWQLSILNGLLSALLIPELETIVFTDVSADFNIAQEHLSTKNLFLKSNPLELTALGWLGLDQDFDMTVTPKIKEIAILKSDSIKKGPTSIIAGLAEQEIRVYGTISNPKYKIKTEHLPKKILEKTGEILMESVQDVIGEFFKK